MSIAQENIEKVRVSWGSDNDGAGSTLDADLLDGLEKEALPINTATRAELDGINLTLSNTPTGTWTFDGTTLVIVSVPAP